MRFVLNGRFLNRPITGVERFALELSRALRAALSERGLPELEVVVPAGTDVEEAATSLDIPAPHLKPGCSTCATLVRWRVDARCW